MCLINDNKNSLKQFVSLDVGVIPDTGVSIEAGSLYDADTETRVEVVEWDNIALSCYAMQCNMINAPFAPSSQFNSQFAQSFFLINIS